MPVCRAKLGTAKVGVAHRHRRNNASTLADTCFTLIGCQRFISTPFGSATASLLSTLLDGDIVKFVEPTYAVGRRGRDGSDSTQQRVSILLHRVGAVTYRDCVTSARRSLQMESWTAHR